MPNQSLTRSLILFASISLSSSAICIAQMDCAKAYPVPPVTTELQGETTAAADAFKGIVKMPPISASLRVKISSTHQDILSKYPKANVVALRQQELSYVCQLLNSDPKLSSSRKALIIQQVGEGIPITADPVPQKRGVKPGDKPVSSAPTPSGGDVTFQTANGDCNAQANGGGSATVGAGCGATNPNKSFVIYDCLGERHTQQGITSIVDDQIVPDVGKMFALERSKDWQGTLNECKRELALHPDFLTSNLFCAEASRNLGDIPSARAYLDSFQKKRMDSYKEPWCLRFEEGLVPILGR